jgi:hypothetical protein
MMKTIFHIVGADTMTFLTKDRFDDAVNDGLLMSNEVACTSEVSDEDYVKLEAIMEAGEDTDDEEDDDEDDDDEE